MTPYIVKNTGGTLQSYAVPCNKCPNCYKRRVSQWSFRLMQQDKISISSHFITLTYDTEHVPINKQGFRTLVKKDLQNFVKRLRKENIKLGNRSKISYYGVGEYGGRTNRPHYHLIIFNGLIGTYQKAWSIGGRSIGAIHYGTVSGASVGYTLKYLSKTCKIGKAEWDTRQPNFALMSKGLGKNYLSQKMISWHLADEFNRMYVNAEGGKKVGMPRYYKEKIYEKNQRKIIGEFARTQTLIRKEKSELLNGKQSERDKAESIAAAFDSMARKQHSGRVI